MRPLRLQLENFASFRGEAAVLDFSLLELFAITGPTGAGKSTLLDAIIFALYGSVPRLGRRGHNEVISLGADRMSVALDFQVGPSTYRVTRQARRRGAGTAQVEQIGPDGSGQPLADGVTQVNDHIQRIVGLTYDAFTQAVILPQGDFQRFLKSKPSDRRDILSKILRLEIYERMRQLASEKSRALDHAVAERDRRLQEDYADATPEALANLEAEATSLRAEIETLSDRLREAEAWRDLVRTARAKTRELEQHRIRLAELQKQKTEIAAQQMRLEASRKAAPVLPQLRMARNAEAAADDAKRARDSTAAAHAHAGQTHERAQERLRQAERQADDIPELEARMAALSVVLGRLQPRSGLAAELANAKKQQLGIERALKEARAAQHQAEADLTASRGRLHRADEALAAVRYDPALYDLLDGVREEASRIADRRLALDTMTAEIAEARTRTESRNQASTLAAAAADKAREQLDNATRELRKIERQLVEARHLAAAAVLRQELRTGEPCPVCEHPVAEHPPALATPALNMLQQRVGQALRSEVTARGRAEKAGSAAADARAVAVAAQEGLDQHAARYDAAQVELRAARAALAERVRAALAPTPKAPIEDQVRQQYRLAAAARQSHDAARTARDAAERAALRLEQEVERLKAAVTGQTERLASLENRAAELNRQIAQIDTDVRKVTQAADPGAERSELDRRRNALAAAVETSRAALTQAQTDFAGAGAHLEAAEAALAKALSNSDQTRAAAEKAVRAAGFANAAAAMRAELTTAEQQGIATEVERYRSEFGAVEARESELAAELGGQEMPQQQLDEAEAQAKEVGDRLRGRERDLAIIGERMQALADAIRRADALRAELDQRRAEYAIYRMLALDLRNDKFQAFLLQETFGELVAGASLRLWELTQRYRFEWKDEAFQVVDHDNARQMRSADTLSGGETFLASLALALQLSDQVQKAAGATALDSLFIDEGFGTLDPEALEAAAGAIETLPVGGRMVGIITHIEELSLRLSARVRVGKTAAGSRLTLEAG